MARKSRAGAATRAGVVGDDARVVSEGSYPCVLAPLGPLFALRSAVAGTRGGHVMALADPLPGQVVQKPRPSRELLGDVLDELPVAALGAAARRALRVLRDVRRVRGNRTASAVVTG